MKTACAKQCPQCPFRPDSLPSYLGDYTAASVVEAVWGNQPFFCHTKIDYTRGRAMDEAAQSGKLCRGSIAFAAKLGVPLSGGNPEVVTARLANKRHGGVECMDPIEFKAHHNPANSSANLRKLKKISKGSSVGPARGEGKPTDEEVAAELVALKALRPLIVPQSMFGDDNLAQLEVQITVLEERLDEYEAGERWSLLDEDHDEDGQLNADLNNEEGRSDDKASSAMAAAQWLDGHNAESLANGWPLK